MTTTTSGDEKPSRITALTTTFTPDPKRNCNTIYKGWVEDGDNFYGGWYRRGDYDPSWSASCFPPGFEPTNANYYSPGVCPSGSTVGCSGEHSGTTTATCCPNGYVCKQPRNLGDDAACISKFGTEGRLSVTEVTYSADGRLAGLTPAGDLTVGAEDYVVGWGVIIQRQASDPEWTATTTTTDGGAGAAATKTAPSNKTPIVAGGSGAASEWSPTATASPGLTGGAKAGIAVGVVLGVGIVAAGIAAAWILARRKRRATAAAAAAPGVPASSGHEGGAYAPAASGGHGSPMTGTGTETTMSSGGGYYGDGETAAAAAAGGGGGGRGGAQEYYGGGGYHGGSGREVSELDPVHRAELEPQHWRATELPERPHRDTDPRELAA